MLFETRFHQFRCRENNPELCALKLALIGLKKIGAKIMTDIGNPRCLNGTKYRVDERHQKGCREIPTDFRQETTTKILNLERDQEGDSECISAQIQ